MSDILLLQLTQIAICIGLITVFILFPGLAHSGAKEGTLLFFESLFPYLFPYLIASSWLLAASKSLHLPNWVELAKVYILGSVGGFPTGAIIVTELYNTQQLPKKSAEILLALCHSPNPLFVIGFVSIELLNRPAFGYVYFITLHSITIIMLLILKRHIKFTKTRVTMQDRPHFFTIIQQSIQTTFVIGGVIIFFSTILTILLALLQNSLPVPLLLLLSSSLEMTNGLVFLREASPAFLYTLCAIGLTAQSASIHLQVVLFAKKERLSVKRYFMMRVIMTCIIGLLFLGYELIGII